MATSAAQSTPSPATSKQEHDEHPFLAWLEAKQKPLLIAVGAIFLIALTAWYVVEAGRRKQVQASDALERARAAMESGNLPEASSEFQKVTQNFSGTDAALEAVLALNQVRMLSGQSQLAVDELRKFLATNPPGFFSSAAHSHLAMALENTGKGAEAAAEYQKAAETATESYRKVDALLNVARVQRGLGKDKEAVETLSAIIKQFPAETPGVPEAKVRLAELTGGRV